MKFLFFIFFFQAAIGAAQQSTDIKILPLFEGKEIILNEPLTSISGATFEISTLRFYVSKLAIQTVQGEGLMPDESHFLCDLENPESLHLFESPDGILSIDFLLGTDSITNVSGILDGPLDPINGMYWAWNSGYINFKVEGKSSLSASQGNAFEFHIGGYLPPFETAREIHLVTNPKDKEIVIELNLDDWLNAIDLSKQNSLMIPGEKASKLADQLVPAFSVRKNDK